MGFRPEKQYSGKYINSMFETLSCFISNEHAKRMDQSLTEQCCSTTRRRSGTKRKVNGDPAESHHSSSSSTPINNSATTNVKSEPQAEDSFTEHIETNGD